MTNQSVFYDIVDDPREAAILTIESLLELAADELARLRVSLGLPPANPA